MKNISATILEHNLDGMPRFLAKLTQRGSQLTSLNDVVKLYQESKYNPPSENMMKLPHGTIKRMNYITFAIFGLSTKAVSQLRTHATRLTFVSTSTQYSEFSTREDNYVLPPCPNNYVEKQMRDVYAKIHKAYKQLIDDGIDRDIAGYLLPQGLRKTLIISGHMDAWQYVFQTRLCKRNTKEVQEIMKMLYKLIETNCGKEYLVGFLPNCAYGKCLEGKFACGKPFTKEI